MPTPHAIEDAPRATVNGTKWRTLDEAAERLRFPSRRALLYYLRRNPAPVFKRNGSTRYFMRDQDIDQIMVPVERRSPPRELADLETATDAEFTPAELPPARTSTRRRRRGREVKR